jgi:hypothetical protein
LKTGFGSVSVEVVKWTCRLFAKLALELSERTFSDELWAWFSSESGALDISLTAANTHKAAVYDVYVEMLMYIAQFSLLELFTLKLRNSFSTNAAYLQTMHEFFLVAQGNDNFIADLV